MTARNTQLINCCKYNFNPILIDADFTVNLSDINTTTKTINVYSNPSAKHTITLVQGNNFISSFKDVKIKHDTNNLKHITLEGVSFDNCDILAKDGATVVVSNVSIKNCTITASQIQCTDEYTNTDYIFTDNTWIANTIYGIVLTAANVDSLNNCVISNNRIANNMATRTRLFLSPNIPAHNIKITDNVIFNPHVSTDTPLADGVIGAFTSVDSASEFTLTVTGNTVYSSTLNTAMTLGKASDTYHKFTMIYKDNNIMLNTGTVAVPEWSSILSTTIQTNGAFYTNFIGDLDTSAKLVLQHATYSASDVTTLKTLQFNPARCVGYVPQPDGTLITSEHKAYYKADVTIKCAGVDTSIPFANYVQIAFAGVAFDAFLGKQSSSTLRATLYIEPSSLAAIDGIMQMTIRSNGAIASVDGEVKLFRLA